MTEQGHVLAVTQERLGDDLLADASAGATSLTVDFGELDELGGTAWLNGQILTYSSVDDDTGIVTLTTPLAADADAGDRVFAWDTGRQTIVTDLVAQVQVDGDVEGDPHECSVELQLVKDLSGGIRGLIGESVLIEEEDDDWRVIDVLGLGDPSASGDQYKIDAFTVAAPGAQSLALTYVPIPDSHHLYWNGDEQEGAYTIVGQTAEIDSTEGADLEVGDDLVVKYAYRKGYAIETVFAPIDIPGMLIWYSSDYPSHSGPMDVADWQDISGNNYHATAQPFGGGMPQWLPTSGPDFGPTMRFHTGYFALPQAPFDGLTEAECWFVVKADAEQTLASFHQLTGSGDFQHYNDPISHWQEQWGTGTRRDLGALGVVSWKRINFWTAPNDWAANLDGINVVHDTISNTVGFGQIGNNYEIGIGYTPAGAFPGSVACFLMWDHKLSTDERAAVEAYLTANPSGGRP